MTPTWTTCLPALSLHFGAPPTHPSCPGGTVSMFRTAQVCRRSGPTVDPIRPMTRPTVSLRRSEPPHWACVSCDGNPNASIISGEISQAIISVKLTINKETSVPCRFLPFRTNCGPGDTLAEPWKFLLSSVPIRRLTSCQDFEVNMQHDFRASR